jgi:Putative collagen-binding domain of a collagenase
VPDQAHKLVTAGYGTFAPDRNVGSSTYVTTAATPDGRLAISYLPAGGTIVVDMTRLAGRVRARWFDPANGRYGPVRDAFSNAGTVR